MQKQKYTLKPNRLIYFAQETAPFSADEMKNIQEGSGKIATVEKAKQFLHRNLKEVEELVKKEYGNIVNVHDEQGGTIDYELPLEIRQNLELEIRLLQETIDKELENGEMTAEKLSTVRQLAYEISNLIGFKIEVQKIKISDSKELSVDQFYAYQTTEEDKEQKLDLKNPQYSNELTNLFKIIDNTKIDWPGLGQDDDYSKAETNLKSFLLNKFVREEDQKILKSQLKEYEELISAYLKENEGDMTQEKVDELITKINEKYDEHVKLESQENLEDESPAEPVNSPAPLQSEQTPAQSQTIMPQNPTSPAPQQTEKSPDAQSDKSANNSQTKPTPLETHPHQTDIISQNWATKKEVAFTNLKDRTGKQLQKGAKYRLVTNMSDFHIRTDNGEPQKITLPKGAECEIIEDQKAYSVLNKYSRNYDYVKIKYTVDGKETIGWTANGYFEKTKDAVVEVKPMQGPELSKPEPETQELQNDEQKMNTAEDHIKSKSYESELIGDNLVIHLAPQLKSELEKYVDSFLPEMREGLKAKVVTPILKEYELTISKNEITTKTKAEDIKKYLDESISKREIKQDEINQKLESARTDLNTFAWNEIFTSENHDLFEKYRDKYLGVDTIGSFEVQDNQVTFEVDLYGEAKNAKISVNNPKNVQGGYFEGKFEKNNSIYPISGCRTIESMFAEIERSRLRYQYEREPVAEIAEKESTTSTIELDEENLKEIKENMRKKFNLGKKVWENLLNEWTIQDLEKFKEKNVKMDKTQKRGDLINEINEVYIELGKTPINKLRGFFDNADYTIVGLKEFSSYMIWNKKHLKTQLNPNEKLDSVLTGILKMNTGH